MPSKKPMPLSLRIAYIAAGATIIAALIGLIPSIMEWFPSPKGVPDNTPQVSLFWGRIVDKNNNRVQNAQITIVETKQSGTTDENGDFRFHVSYAGNVHVLVKIEGVLKYEGTETVPGNTTIQIKN